MVVEGKGDEGGKVENDYSAILAPRCPQAEPAAVSSARQAAFGCRSYGNWRYTGHDITKIRKRSMKRATLAASASL